MSAVVRQRARIARVRRLQHGLAAAAAAEASGRVQLLETNDDRLARMRADLQAGTGMTDAAALARRGELAMRIDAARVGLDRSLAGARTVAATRESVRLAARRDQESAERLEQNAVTAARRLAERRPMRAGRLRTGLTDDGDIQ